MKGTLSEQPLTELVREIGAKRLSGTLRLQQEQIRMVIYFERGRVTFAASNVKTLRLREYLTKKDLVSKKELAGYRDNGSDLALAKSLGANGTLTQLQVTTILTTLVNDVLRVGLLWTEGSWEFDQRTHLDESVALQIDANTLLREAAQRLPLNFVSVRFRNPGETLSRTARASNYTALLPAESFILSRLDNPTSLDELVAISGLRELDAFRIIYGLALGGLIKREYWQSAFRETVVPEIEEPEDLAETAAVSSGTPDVVWEGESESNELQTFLERIDAAGDYYEIIDVSRDAAVDEIKDAYYKLARRYHPDRFHLKSGTSLHARLSSTFAQVTHAYETLTDERARATYDAGLQRSKQFAEAAKASDAAFDDDLDMDAGASGLGAAEYNFREGHGALMQGRIQAAVTQLAAAARMNPNSAKYRAYYGRALAADDKTRRLAESELQAALKLEPSNATYRTMLAELYFELRFHRRAQTEVERALALDPQNESARVLLRKLDRSRRAG
jgi:curved DNA-binding protein CbpA